MIFKKLFCWIICLFFMAMPMMAADFTVGDLRYFITDSTEFTVSVKAKSRYISGDITVPDKIEYEGVEYTVTSMGDEAFRDCEYLTSIHIPEYLTTIGDNVFRGCIRLSTINIPSSLTSVGKYAFNSCRSLTSIELPESVTYIGEYAFAGCYELTSFSIPSLVTKIETGIFQGCSSLSSISIPNSVTSIGWYAFYGCPIVSVDIPDSVTEIMYGTFIGCTKLKSVNWPSSLTSIGELAFSRCHGLESIDIPNSVTSIGKSAFSECQNLTSIKLPSNIPTIEEELFYECKSLTSVEIPSGVTSIEDKAFYNCGNLTSVKMPSSVTSIGEKAFSGCYSLCMVVPSSVTSIKKYEAFNNVKVIYYDGPATGSPWWARHHIKRGIIDGDFVYADEKKDTLVGFMGTGSDISIPDNVVVIDKDAFEGCFWITSVAIPSSVISIGENAFSRSLTSIIIPSTVTSIEEKAFYNVDTIYYAGPATGSPWGAKHHIKAIIDGDFVYVDEQKDTLVYYLGVGPDVVISDHVNTIGKKAFDENSYIKSVTIPSSVTSIGDYAFYQCRNLSPVTIPSSVASIGKSAFYNVDTIYYAGPATGSPWGAKHHIKAIIDGDFIYGDEKKTVLKQYIGSDSIVVIPDNVVTIKDSAFINNTTIQSVVIPNSVETIGSYAFAGCTGISRLSVPYTVSDIRKDAFYQVDTVSYGGFAVWQWWETQYWGALNFDEEGDDLYIIHNLEELLYFRDSVKGIARLEADIYLSTVCGRLGDEMVSFTPIKCLKFNGGNHTISNLYINQPNSENPIALFDNGTTGYRGGDKISVKNLKVTNAYVKGGEKVAGIAINGDFVNCHFEGVVIGKYAGGISEYGKQSFAYNCSNYGMVVSTSFSTGIYASSMYNCYNRGRIVSDESAIGLGMYCCEHFNIYNSGDVYAPDSKNIYYIETDNCDDDSGSLFALQEMDSSAFLSGAVKDSLNKYVSQNPKAYDYYSDSIPLLQWVQGEDGFPRFEGVDLKPTQGYVVRYTGAIEDYDVALNGTVALPVCRGNSYVFSNNFDGKNIVSDTTIIVEMAKKDSIWGLEMRGDFDADGYISLSFYTNMDNEGDRFAGIHGDFYTQNENKEYFFVNSYLFSKAGVICDYVQESDSIWKVTLDSIYYSIEYDSLALYVGYYDSKVRFNTNVLSWTKGATGDETSVSTISNLALEVYADDETIHVANAQPNTKIQVFDMNGKVVASGVTDAEGSVEMKLPAMNGVYVVSDGNQSTKVVVK